MTFNFLPNPIKHTMERTTTSEGRKYVTPEGKVYDSVTTVVGFDKAQFFANWRVNNPVEANRTAQRGTILHTLMEQYLRDEIDPAVRDEIDPAVVDEAEMPIQHKLVVPDLFHQLRGKVDKHLNNIQALETGLWSDTLRLAGTVDCLAEWDGVPAVIDFKGATNPKFKSDINNYFMQGCAYAIAWQERTGQKIPKIVIIIASEQGNTAVYEERPVDWVKPLKEAITRFRQSPKP